MLPLIRGILTPITNDKAGEVGEDRSGLTGMPQANLASIVITSSAILCA